MNEAKIKEASWQIRRVNKWSGKAKWHTIATGLTEYLAKTWTNDSNRESRVWKYEAKPLSGEQEDAPNAGDIAGSISANGSASMFDTLEPSEIHTLYIVLDVFKSLAKLRRTIGHTVIGQHPDEINPRAETWMKERQNWEAEVDSLRKRVSDLEARLNADIRRSDGNAVPSAK